MFHPRVMFLVGCLVAWCHWLPAQAPVKSGVLDIAAPLANLAEHTSQRPTIELFLRPPLSEENGFAPISAAKRIGVDIHVPSLHLHTTGPDTLVVGEPAEYLVTLANRGQAEARNIQVRISLPNWIELKSNEPTRGGIRKLDEIADGNLLAWDILQVAAQTDEQLSLILEPREGRAFDLRVDAVVRPNSSAAAIAVNQPQLDLAWSGPDDFAYGDEAPFSISLTNPGTADARDVRIDVFAGQERLASQPVGTIAAGSDRIVDLKIRPAARGTHSLRAIATASPGLRSEAVHSFRVRREVLNVDLQGPAVQYAGTKVTYRMRVTNVGDADAEDVALRLALPPEVKYVDGLADAVVSEQGVLWKANGIPVGGEIPFDAHCELVQGGHVELAVDARTASGFVASGTARTRVQSVAHLKLDVHAPNVPCPLDADVEYEIRVINRGTATARKVYILATCSTDVEPVDVSGNAVIQSGQVIFRPIAELQAGQTITHKVAVRARKAGNHTFHVVVECEDPETRLVTEEATRFFLPSAPAQAAVPRANGSNR